MANYELHLIRKIVESKNGDTVLATIMNDIGSTDVFLVYKEEFEKVVKYRNKYGKFPDKSTLDKYLKGTDIPKAPEPVQFYIDEVKNSYLYNQMSDINSAMVEKLKASDPVAAYRETLARLNNMQGLKSIATDINLADTLADRIKQYALRRTQQGVNGIPTGWSLLDNETCGWQRGEVVYLYGRMKGFKTWCLLAWADYSWEQGFTPLFFSKEMGSLQLARRLDTLGTQTRFKDIKTGTIDDKGFKTFSDKLKKKYSKGNPFYIIDSAGSGEYNVEFIESKIRQYKPDVVYIDGVYMLKSQGKSDWEKQTEISRAIKQVALNLNVPIVGTMQANRGGATSSKLGTQHVAYSDAYAQDCDYLIALNRVYDKLNECFKNEIIVEIAASRESENVKARVQVDLDNMLIAEAISQMLDTDLGDFDDEEEGSLI